MHKIVFIVSLFIVLAGKAQQPGTWETTRYADGDNALPHSAIALPQGQGFIVLGQRFLQTDSVQHTCALVKLSPNGKFLKETFFGSDKSRLVNMATDGKDRILLSGVKKDRLWIRRINPDLGIVSDTVFQAFEAKDLYHPKVLFDGSDLIVVLNANPVQVVRMDDRYSVIWQQTLTNKFCTDKVTMTYEDAALDGHGHIVITGDSDPFQPHNHNDKIYNYDAFFAQLDAATGQLQWLTPYGSNSGYFTSAAIVSMKDKYYATGMSRNNKGGPGDQFDTFIGCLDQNGKLLWTRSFGGTDTEYASDLAVFGDKLKIVGKTWSHDGVMARNSGMSDYYIATITADGKDLQIKVSGTAAMEEFTSIQNIGGGYALILGNAGLSPTDVIGNMWRILKTKD